MFRDKIVVVTGGASGIGKAISRRFAQDGAKIAIIDYNKEYIAALEQEFTNESYDFLTIFCDITQEEDCKNAMNKIINQWGGIDILINNAGITVISLFEKADLSLYRKIFDINFFGAVHCTKYALDSIIERKGSIVALSSISGFGPLAERTGYSSTKHAMHGFFESLRVELYQYGVHVMMVCPGFVRTNLHKTGLDGKGQRNIQQFSSTGKMLEPEHIANEIFKGVLKRKRIVLPSKMSKIAYIVKRISPAYYEYSMRKRFVKQ